MSLDTAGGAAPEQVTPSAVSDALLASEVPTRLALETTVRANERAVREWLLALLQLHDRKLYLETCGSWADYALETFGYSRSTANRLLAQGREMLALEAAPADKAAGQRVPRAGHPPSQRQAAQAQKDRRTPIPAASTEATSGPASAPVVYRPPEPAPAYAPPSLKASIAHLIDHFHALDPSEAGAAMTAAQLDIALDWMEHCAKAAPRRRAGKQHGTRPIPVDSTETAEPSSGGAEIQRPAAPTDEAPTSPLPAPPDPPKNPTSHVPSLRQEASAAFRALHDATEGIGEKWTAEEATYWENRSKREVDAWRAAHGIASGPPAKPQRRQGTITRPPGEPKRQAWADRPRNTVRTDRPQTTTLTAKRHADDCSCLSCVPPKAVAK